MELRALKTFRSGNANIRRGTTVTMTEARAREHLAKDLVEEVKAPKKEADPKKPAKDA